MFSPQKLDFVEFIAHPCLNQTQVLTFQREILERNSLNSVILSLQDWLADLSTCSVFRVYRTKEFFC